MFFFVPGVCTQALACAEAVAMWTDSNTLPVMTEIIYCVEEVVVLVSVLVLMLHVERHSWWWNSITEPFGTSDHSCFYSTLLDSSEWMFYQNRPVVKSAWMLLYFEKILFHSVSLIRVISPGYHLYVEIKCTSLIIYSTIYIISDNIQHN